MSLAMDFGPEDAPHFNVSSWSTREPFSEAEYMSAVDRYAVPDADGKPVRRSLVIPQSRQRADARMFTVREHEWTHFRQHVSSPHGIFIHRLCSIQEDMTLRYFQGVDDGRWPYMALPFRVMRFRDLDNLGDVCIQMWSAAESLKGLLWGKTATIRELKYAWTLLGAPMESAGHINKLLPGDRVPAKIVSAMSDDSQTCGHGNIAIRDVAEGFAKFREFWQLASIMGTVAAQRFVPKSRDAKYTSAAEFVAASVGVDVIHHPFVGALFDVAIQCFVDPFMSDGEVVWEKVHPGLRLMEVVKRIGARSSKAPEKPDECYREALRAFGLRCPVNEQHLRWIDAGSRTARPVDPATLQLPEVSRQFQADALHGASKLRSEFEGIYFWPSLFPDGAGHDQFTDICRPAVIEQSNRIFVPWGWSRNNDVVNANIMYAFMSLANDGISRDGNFRRAFAFGRKARRLSLSPVAENDTIHDLSSVFSDEAIVKWIELYFGRAAGKLALAELEKGN